MKKTNLGVQLFPLMLLGLSVMYRLNDQFGFAVFCFCLSLLMWFVLWLETYNKN